MKKYSLVLFCLAVITLHGQVSLPVVRNIQQKYANGTRSASGQPGAAYWQNTADYQLNIQFDPATRKLTGAETVTYTNNSPDSLRILVLKLYQNIYQIGATRAMPFEGEDINEGIRLYSVSVNGKVAFSKDSIPQGTNWTLRLPKAVGPKQQVTVDIAYSYVLNKGSHLRTGEIEPGADFVAYFFPRIAVYDDIDGWNRAPYIGSQEFYNDFCNFQLAVTVPKNYAVWATGDLLNAREVFVPTVAGRLAAAEQKDAVVDVIDTFDLKKGQVVAPNASNTFRFSAANVPDVAFAVSDHYVWKSTSLVVDKKTGRRTRVDAVFNPKHKDFWEVIDFARKTVEVMSFDFPKWPFPYAHETVFDGLDQMEYPMMVNDNPLESREESIELTDHEIFHTMFPFYMGINETKYGWMDEGWATIGEWLVSPQIDPSIVDEYGVEAVNQISGTENDVPIMTLTTMLTGPAAFTNNYPKPGMGYLFARDMLGDELFFKGLHYYIGTWNGKHPMPYDFFNCMNAGSGRNLNWFWKRWFFDGGVPDLAIMRFDNSVKDKSLVIESLGTKPVPVDLTFTFTDGTTQKLHYPADVWETGTSLSVTLTTDKVVKNIVLGSTYVPDVDKKNNVWGAEK